MRKSKGYWLWGQFSKSETLYLNSIKEEAQSILKSPKFDIHLTITGPYKSLNKSFLNNLNLISKNNQKIELNLENYDFSSEFYKSFFIKTNNPVALSNLRNKIHSIYKINAKEKYFPHISLAYGIHSQQIKDILISKLSGLKDKIVLSKISCVDVNEELSYWRVLKTFNLEEIK